MIKLLAFDIDNTLAEINKPILSETRQQLIAFEKKGVKIAFVSGKPSIYISGMVRQVGLESPIIIGENGLSIYYGCSVPPSHVINCAYSNKDRELLLSVKAMIMEHFGEDVWFQPNEVSVTAFPKNIEMSELREVVLAIFEDEKILETLVYYQHSDSIDIAPKQVNKGNAIQQLLDYEGWTSEHIIGIGDGENDIPLFEKSGRSIGVDFQGDYKVDTNVPSIAEAMDLLNNIV